MKKKILFFTENLYGGGVEQISQIIISHFDYSKYDIVLYSLCEHPYDSSLYSPLITYKYIFDKINVCDTFFQRFTKRLKNKLKLIFYYHVSPVFFYKVFIREKVDVAIAFIEGYATRIVSGAPNSIKKIAWIHTDLIENHWTKVAYINNQEEKLCMNSYDYIVCVSKVVMENAKKIFGASNNYRLLYNPIDVNAILRKSLEPVERIKTHKILLVTLGSLIPIKGYERLLKVINLLRHNFDIELYIYGQGKDYSRLKQLIEILDLSNIVRLAGYKDNPYPYLKQADVYVCSSYAEGYNTAITEALLLGKPVVSTECSGVKEQLGKNNEWGICCENSEDGLYQGLKNMLTGDKRLYYAKQALIRGNFFSLQSSMNEIYKIVDA